MIKSKLQEQTPQVASARFRTVFFFLCQLRQNMYQIRWKSFSFIMGTLLEKKNEACKCHFSSPLLSIWSVLQGEAFNLSLCWTALFVTCENVSTGVTRWGHLSAGQRSETDCMANTPQSCRGSGSTSSSIALRQGWLALAWTPQCKHAPLEIRLGNRKQWRDLGLPVVFSVANSSVTPSNVRNYSSPLTGVYTH